MNTGTVCMVAITGLMILIPQFSPIVCGSEIIEEIVAKVDRYIITRSELAEASQPSIDQIRGSFPPEEWDRRIREVQARIVNQMIHEYVVLRFARDNDLRVSETEIDGTIMDLRKSAGIDSEEVFKQQLAMEGVTLEEVREILRRQSLVRRVLRNEVYSKVRVTDTEIREYYTTNSDMFRTTERVRAAVLMINTDSGGLFAQTAAEEKIHGLHDQLKKGADFAELVAQHSDGPARSSGGDIGYLEKGRIQPVIEEAAFSLEEGQFSRPLKTDFGWLLVKVLEKEPSGFKPLEEVREDIEMHLQQQKAVQAEQAWFDVQKTKTYIEILDY